MDKKDQESLFDDIYSSKWHGHMLLLMKNKKMCKRMKNVIEKCNCEKNKKVDVSELSNFFSN